MHSHAHSQYTHKHTLHIDTHTKRTQNTVQLNENSAIFRRCFIHNKHIHFHWHALMLKQRYLLQCSRLRRRIQKPRNLLQRLPEDSSSDDDSPFDAYYETSEEEAKK